MRVAQKQIPRAVRRRVDSSKLAVLYFSSPLSPIWRSSWATDERPCQAHQQEGGDRSSVGVWRGPSRLCPPVPWPSPKRSSPSGAGSLPLGQLLQRDLGVSFCHFYDTLHWHSRALSLRPPHSPTRSSSSIHPVLLTFLLSDHEWMSGCYETTLSFDRLSCDLICPFF